MRKAFAITCLAVVAVLGMALLAGPAFAAKGPIIKSVKFSGFPKEPTVVIKGRGMGSLPFEAAEAVPPCFEEEVASGDDFGTTVTFQEPSEGWTAGEGPGDCIGLVFSTFTETEVVYHFGSAYSHYSPLAKGDEYSLTINGLTHSGTVKIKKEKKQKL